MYKYCFYHLFFGLILLNVSLVNAQLSTGKIIYNDPKLEKLLPRNTKIEVIGSGFQHIEGPVWVPDSNMLLFSDIKAGIIYRWTKEKGTSKFLEKAGFSGRLPYGEEPGSNGLAVTKSGTLIICQHGDRRLAEFPLNGKYGLRTLTDNYQGKRYNSPNDVAIKSDGTVYFTDPAYGLPQKENDPLKEAPVNGVYKMDSGGSVQLLIFDLKYPNGLTFSPDEQTLYVSVSDKLHPQILKYSVNKDGTVGRGKVFFDASGVPKNHPDEVMDGLKTDAEGNIWASGPGGILIIDKSGKHLGTISTSEISSNCCWNEDKSILYISAGSFLYKMKIKYICKIL